MGVIDFFLGRVPPAPGVAPKPAAEVAAALLALDRPTAPYTVRRAAAGERGDIVAEWRIVDAHWYQIFARAGLNKNFKIFLRLDEPTHTVRTQERRASVEWRVGVPKTFIEGEVHWGHETTWEFGTGVGFTEQLRPGVVYNYRFNSSEIQQPLEETVAKMGWTWRAVAFGRL